MRKETSFGIVPLRFDKAVWQVLLIQHHAGHWAFPKGHANPGESFQQTAERELLEETGLTVRRYLSPHPLIENYYFSFKGQLISKKVQYFLAVVEGNVVIQEIEIKDSQWVLLSEAPPLLSFKESKRVCMQAIDLVKTLEI